MDPMTLLTLLMGGSAALSTGGSVASSLLGKTPKERTATQLPSSNPAISAATLQLLARLGFPITGEVALQASPLNQALNRRFATPVSRESRRRILTQSNRVVQLIADARAAGDTRSTQEILDEVWPGITDRQERDAVLRAANEGGFTTVAELIDAELGFRDQVKTMTDSMNATSAQQRQLQTRSLEEQAAALDALGAGSDITTLRGQERDRLLRDFEDQRTAALAAANASGSNPARALELLDRQRQDIDLTALQRAVSLATGEAGVAATRAETARNLDPTLVALGIAPSFSGGGQLLGVTQSQPNNAVASAIGAGSQAAAQGLGNLGILSLLLANRGPATAGGGADPTAGGDLSWLLG